MSSKPRKFGPRLTVSLTDRDYDRLARVAEGQDVSVSWVVRRAITDFLAQIHEVAEPQLQPKPSCEAERSGHAA